MKIDCRKICIYYGLPLDEIHSVAPVYTYRFAIWHIVNCFRHLQILIDDRSWCLLSSQKCVSHFIGIWNCYLTNCAFGFSMELMFLWDAIKHLLLPCRVKSVERSNFRPIFQCGKLCRSTFLSNIYHFFGNFSLFK